MKRQNDYMTMFDDTMYERTPKAVFAAVCASLFSAGGELRDKAQPRFLDEWRILHEQGIVPQKPYAGCVNEEKER